MSERLTYEEVKSRVESRGYQLISKEYASNSKPIDVLCKNGHIWNVPLNRFWSSKRNCPYCTQRAKLDPEFVFNSIKNEGYKIVGGEFKSNKSELNLICPNGGKWKTNYNRFQQGQRCSCVKCANNRPLSLEFVKNYIESKGEKLLSREYTNNRTKLTVMCEKGHIYHPSFNNFKDSDSRCPKCNQSKGENKIEEFLKEHSIDFIKQYTFDDCRSRRLLPFDFYLPETNILIEYDGKQHYIKGCFGADDMELEEIKLRDSIKTEYCKKNKIKLIRIPYWKINDIEKILNKKINL